ncbi:hypothetical protein PC116_g24011 [Phytophthora cactorum]|uniref:Uncharacterized protein n=1 Tax=Phytophthora cactorum TaxID=29920 RepID=A0A8T1BB23_9STRA|nr:hypothetical protein PC117_g22327 [Phytophthora cactorum]KAG2976847.1 hypothetical protein PC119_g22071 [Phytophthora cactorum]KAG3132568.1 hypothetical protein C6341_g22861 [Phytophthora cactorum]KAG4227611.1 hypothetical protein PC116_g24011 [Phytophthora cactorum]
MGLGAVVVGAVVTGDGAVVVGGVGDVVAGAVVAGAVVVGAVVAGAVVVGVVVVDASFEPVPASTEAVSPEARRTSLNAFSSQRRNGRDTHQMPGRSRR